MDNICEQCRCECEIKIVDYGIGAYEYAGAPGFDSRPTEVSVCCEADVVQGRNTVISTTTHKDRNGNPYTRIVTRHEVRGQRSTLSVKKEPLALLYQ